MIIIKLQGGLGNQLFQYAFGRYLSIHNNIQLKLDISGFAKDKLRDYSLKYFNIVENFASAEEVVQYNKYEIGILKILEKLKPEYKKKIIKSTKNIGSIEKIKDNRYITGYWQSEKYFKSCADTIRKEFTLKGKYKFKDNNLLNKINLPNSVSLHIRRTDYTTNKANVFYNLDFNYYLKAIEEIKKIDSHPVFFIFSDDINWVKKNFKISYPVHFVSNDILEDYQELIFMGKCKHNIIANSSFSWWGAWLNNNPNKNIIAPNQWYTDKERNTENLLPESWIKI